MRYTSCTKSNQKLNIILFRVLKKSNENCICTCNEPIKTEQTPYLYIYI